MEHYDVIVAGAGAMGMAAGYHLAAAGRRTLLIDVDDPPHGNGAHHGDTRIIRHAYGEGREYTPLALRAQALWLQLERETGKRLFLRTGFLQAGEPGSRMLEEVIGSASAHGLPIDIVRGEELRRRWPGLRLPETSVACFEKDSGVLLCESCVAAYRQAATERGAKLLTMAAASAIEPDGDGVTVRTDAGDYRAGALVLTAGKLAGPLLRGLGLNVPLAPIRKTVAWFPVMTEHYEAERFPAFLFDLPEGIFYGFPSIDGSGVKAGRHDGPACPAEPGAPLPPFGARAEDGRDVSDFMERYMPGVRPTAAKGAACVYTMTPDEHFIVDRHPAYPHIAIGAGFSGHGFKFASAIGEMLARLAMNERPAFDIPLFSLARFHNNET